MTRIIASFCLLGLLSACSDSHAPRPRTDKGVKTNPGAEERQKAVSDDDNR